MLAAWADPRTRGEVVAFLDREHIDLGRVTAELAPPGAETVDTVDQLLHLAWNRPTLTRAERARTARTTHAQDLDAYGETARRVLDLLLDRYAEAGINEIAAPTVVQVPPLASLGSPAQIAAEFGGPDGWHRARVEIQRWLYAA